MARNRSNEEQLEVLTNAWVPVSKAKTNLRISNSGLKGFDLRGVFMDENDSLHFS